MSLLPPSETGAPPSTAQSVKSARSDLVGTIHVPRKLRDVEQELLQIARSSPSPYCQGSEPAWRMWWGHPIHCCAADMFDALLHPNSTIAHDMLDTLRSSEGRY